jgi:Golgi nucleoside diphosphatase
LFGVFLTTSTIINAIDCMETISRRDNTTDHPDNKDDSLPLLDKQSKDNITPSKIKTIDHVTFAMMAAKPKYGSVGVCQQIIQKLRQNIRMVVVLLMILSLGYFGVQYFDVLAPTSRSTGLPLDRSETYRVKVLPTSLTDEQLNALPKETFSYLAMIDAGSSGCRAHVYRYGKLGSTDGPLYVVPQHQSKKVKPGLSSFSAHPQDAGMSLEGLVDFLKEQVPQEDWLVTPIWLKATAGLRMLPSEQSEKILDSVRDFLSDKKKTPFLFRRSWAKVIPGIEEGGFGWIAFNYLKRVIGPKRDKTNKATPFAVIEMGGASAQVSQLAPSEQEANTIPSQHRFSFNVEGEDYHLYTHSYLGYGAEQARIQFSKILKLPDVVKTTQTDPCVVSTSQTAGTRLLSSDHHRHLQMTTTDSPTAPTAPIDTPASGLIHDIAACIRSVSSLFSQATLEAIGSLVSSGGKKADVATVVHLRRTEEVSSCSNLGPYSFGCVFQPSFVANSENILAFENYFYMSSALGVKPLHHGEHNINSSTATTFPLTTTPALIRKASDEYCSMDWNAIQANFPKDAQPKDVNDKNCFLSAFAYSFLVDGLKVPSHKAITIQKEVDGSEIEWALGAAYKETAEFLKRTNLRPT